jgi:hypothetical protein
MAEKCKSCGAAIIWATTQSGKLMPLDAAPDPKGNLAVQRYDKAIPATLVVPRSEMTEVLGLPTHKSHFATCPNAAAHRKAKR